MKEKEATLSADKTVLKPGDTTSLHLRGTLMDGKTADLRHASVTYSTNNGAAVAVDPQGNVTAVQEGTVQLKATVSLNGAMVESAEVSITVDGTPPVTVAAASPDVLSGWLNHDVVVTLQACDSGSGVAASYYTVDGGAQQQGTSIAITAEGAHTISYWSVDTAGNAESPHTVTVLIDKTAPTLHVALDKTVIWPPNHKLLTVNAIVDADDSLSGLASIVLTSVTSNEPDAGSGDGDLPNDIQGADIGSMDTQFSLRVERSETGGGRMYTITYTATDKAGNRTDASATVTVPHNQSGQGGG